ncbi:MAG: glycosyltransferase [Chloroflexi bacterium]|nr:glycosyltransferase [Chloroflexota bacterium]
MRVLHIHITDNIRAAGGIVVARRLHLGLKRAGVDSKILCGRKTTNLPDIVEIPRSRKLESQIRRVTSRLGLNDIHAVSSFGIRKSEVYLNADILHIQGIHSNFFSYLALPWLTQTKPAVFTLHDMWALTGHCAISYDCDRWKIGCGQCPYPDVIPSIRRDNTRLDWRLKNWVYARSNLTIVAPSSQLTEQARQSMLNRFPIYHIPHGIDTETYQPIDPEQCRWLLGVPSGKKVLMFAALNMNHFWKGGDLLLKALQSLPKSLKAETVLLLLGNGGEAIAEAAGIQTLHLGYISNDRLKTIAYSAADLFVSPTRAEAFGLVLLESMACGTPVVSFRVGGVPDLARPGITGYLAEPEDADDLRNEIIQLLEDESLRNYMSQQCRAIVLKEYTLELQIERYIELYRQILKTKTTGSPRDG